MLLKDIEERKTVLLTLITIGVILMGWVIAHKLYHRIKTIQDEVVSEIKEIEKETTAIIQLLPPATPKEESKVVANDKLLPAPMAKTKPWKNLKTQVVRESGDVPDITAMDKYSVIDLAVYVASKTGVPAEYILCFLWVESKFFRDIGRPGKGIADGHVNRDAALFYLLCTEFGYNPCDTPASRGWIDKRGRPMGYGGASQGAQVIPCNLARLNGFEANLKEIFSDCHHWYKGADLKIIQQEINRHFGGKVITVDGTIGTGNARVDCQVSKRHT